MELKGKGNTNLIFLENDQISPSEILLNNNKINFNKVLENTLPSLIGYIYCINIDSNKEINTVIIKWETLLASTSYMFYNNNQLISLNIKNFNTSAVTNMDSMFFGCYSLTSINLDHLETSSVTNMKNMFYQCNGLKYIDLKNFNTSLVNNMDNMFGHCYRLESININSLNTSLVNVMRSMFANCYSLISLNLNNFNTSLVKDMSNMFYACNSLKSLHINNFNTKSLNNIKSMFYKCFSLISLDLDKFDTSQISIFENVFYSCNSLVSLNIRNFNTSLAKSMKNMFYECTSLTFLNLGNFDTVSVTSMENMFYGCYSLISLNISSFNTKSLVNMGNMFSYCNNLISIDLSKFDFSNVLNINKMFLGCNNLQFINLSNFYNDLNLNMHNVFLGTPDNIVYCYNNGTNNDNLNKLKFQLSSKKYSVEHCSQNWQNYQEILNNNKCISIFCDENSELKYLYENNCYSKCPEGTHESNNNKYICEKNNNNNDISSQICYLNNFVKNECDTNKKYTKNDYNIIISIIEEIKKGNMTPEISNVLLGKKEDIVIKEGNVIYQITSTYTQNNLKYTNISYIKIAECENLLKAKYNISKNVSLIIFKYDIFLPELLIPIIGYEIFHPTTNQHYDLNICKDIYINTFIPISISDDIIYKHNPYDKYYSDICVVYPNKNNDNITIYDRKNEYNNRNMSICPINCIFIDYDNTIKIVHCKCKIQNSSIIIEKINNKKILLNNFRNIKSTLNTNIIKCYNKLFSKEGLKNNIANYLFLIIIFVIIIETFLFYINEYKNLSNIIANILYSRKENNIFSNNHKLKNEKSPMQIKTVNSKDIFYNKFDNILDKKSTNFNWINYKNNELNLLNYKNSVKYDRRNFYQYYISILKENHLIICLFYNNNDFNTKKIKINFLLFSFSLFYFINALFFTEIAIHYILKGKNFSFFIPQIIYSTFISHFIIIIFKIIFSIKKIMLEISKRNEFEDEYKIKKFIKEIKIKFILFFIICIILLIIFWYYISCFCAVYKKAQNYLIIYTCISFALFSLSPFIIYLLSGLARMESIKNKGKLLFSFGQILKYF